MSIRVPKSPAYLWYPKDALASGRIDDLTATEECWYRRALDRAWDDEGISADPVKAAKRIGKKCTAKAAAKILAEFFIPKRKDATKMVNPRQEIERKKYEVSFRKKSDAGKESGRKRREKKGLYPEHRSNTVRTMNEQSNPNPISISNKEIREEVAATGPKNHPAIIAIQDIIGFYPPREIWQELIDHLGPNIDHGKLKRAFTQWRARGFNKTNYNWALDWYLNGIPKTGQNTNGTNRTNNGHKQTPAEIIANRTYRKDPHSD